MDVRRYGVGRMELEGELGPFLYPTPFPSESSGLKFKVKGDLNSRKVKRMGSGVNGRVRERGRIK